MKYSTKTNSSTQVSRLSIRTRNYQLSPTITYYPRYTTSSYIRSRYSKIRARYCRPNPSIPQIINNYFGYTIRTSSYKYSCKFIWCGIISIVTESCIYRQIRSISYSGHCPSFFRNSNPIPHNEFCGKESSYSYHRCGSCWIYASCQNRSRCASKSSRTSNIKFEKWPRRPNPDVATGG